MVISDKFSWFFFIQMQNFTQKKKRLEKTKDAETLC